MDGVRGVSQPVGVMPTDQPYINRDVKVIVSDPVNVEKIYRENSESIAKLWIDRKTLNKSFLYHDIIKW